MKINETETKRDAPTCILSLFIYGTKRSPSSLTEHFFQFWRQKMFRFESFMTQLNSTDKQKHMEVRFSPVQKYPSPQVAYFLRRQTETLPLSKVFFLIKSIISKYCLEGTSVYISQWPDLTLKALNDPSLRKIKLPMADLGSTTM